MRKEPPNSGGPSRFHSGLPQNFPKGHFPMKKGTATIAEIPFGFKMVPKGGL
jgi:hypothetical protein